MFPSQASPRARRPAWILGALIGSSVALACAKPTSTRGPDPVAGEHALLVERTLLVSEPVQTTLDPDTAAAWTDRILPGPVFACTRDDDCEVIQLDCCDSCEGGRRLAVNRAHIEQANAAWREQGCASAVCEPLTCAQSFAPLCDGGACARREESTGPDGTIEATIVRNVLPVR